MHTIAYQSNQFYCLTHLTIHNLALFVFVYRPCVSKLEMWYITWCWWHYQWWDFSWASRLILGLSSVGLSSVTSFPSWYACSVSTSHLLRSTTLNICLIQPSFHWPRQADRWSDTVDRVNQKPTTPAALDKRYAQPQDSPRIAFGSNHFYARSQRRGWNQSNRVVSLRVGPVTSSMTHIHSSVEHVSRQAVKGCWIMSLHDIVKRIVWFSKYKDLHDVFIFCAFWH